MQQSMLRQRTVGQAFTCSPRRCRTPLCVRAAHQQQQQAEQAASSSSSRAASLLGAAVVAVGISLAAPSMPAEAAPSRLADVMRDMFTFVDEKDGVIDREDMSRIMREISADANVPLINDSRLDFTMRLFDLNGDSVLTSEEMLRSLALDASVSEDAINQDVVEVFDKNRNGLIDKAEFRSGLGDLGSNGDAAKDFVFDRVDRTSQSNGQLDITNFGNALLLARTMILGY